MTLFTTNPVDPSQIQEASRLAKSAAGVWFGGWVLALLLGSVFVSGRGEMAMLGGFFGLLIQLAVGTVSTVFSLRLAVRSLRLDDSSLLPKITIGLNGLSSLYVVAVAALILSDFV